MALVQRYSGAGACPERSPHPGAVMDALRIRMEGGMERIEAATAEARRLAKRLGRLAGPISGLFVRERPLAEEIARFIRAQPAVEEAVDRLARMVTTERMSEGTDPRVLREWRSA